MADGSGMVLADAETVERLCRRRVKITGSAVATDALAPGPADMLRLDAVEASTARALPWRAGRPRTWTSSSSMTPSPSCLYSLEAAGAQGRGLSAAAGGGSHRPAVPHLHHGRAQSAGAPVCHGVYPAAEAVLQLEGVPATARWPPGGPDPEHRGQRRHGGHAR